MANAGPSFVEYLDAKRTVDDRALDQTVHATFARELRRLDSPRILEPGCGAGAMAQRLIDWGTLRGGRYLGIDADPDLVSRAETRFESVSWVRYERAELFEFLAGVTGRFDAVISHAFLDLVDIPSAVPALLSVLEPGGLFYFTLVFDGKTEFRPTHPLDRHVLELYHRSMDERMVGGSPSGSRRSGRDLLSELARQGVDLLASGDSDWIVEPAYTADERLFLAHIVHTIESELTGHVAVDPDNLRAWVRARRAHLQEHRLSFHAHHIDGVGRRPLTDSQSVAN